VTANKSLSLPVE